MNRWSAVTDRIKQRLPRWWKMRRDKTSVGAQFLNVIGLTLEDVEYALHYALDQYYIGKADKMQVDIVYKATLPSVIMPDTRIQISGDSYLLENVPDHNTFLTGLHLDALAYEELFYDDPYFIDWERHLLYVRKPYGTSPQRPEGQVNMQVLDDQGQVLYQQHLDMHIHHVWNFFDEFGLILDTPRLYAEKNELYMKRILDVFQRPANASRIGILNGLGRDLALLQEDQWLDDSLDHRIYQARVVLDSIEVDKQKWPKSEVTIDKSGRATLKGTGSGQPRMITYIAGVEIHALHNKRDLAFQAQLYNADGTATPLLKYYADLITKNVPVMWGQFVFGQGQWDISITDMPGTGFLPVILDADFSKWSTYVPKG